MVSGFRFATALYVLAILPTWLVVIWPATTLAEKIGAPLTQHQCFFIFLAGMVFTLVYSAPALVARRPMRFLPTSRSRFPVGCLLKVAGWSMVASVAHLEPWFIGSILLLVPGRRARPRRTSRTCPETGRPVATPFPSATASVRRRGMIAPFFVVPWLLMPPRRLASRAWEPGHPILTGNPWVLTDWASVWPLWGGYTAY
jgi:hypothetical protein